MFRYSVMLWALVAILVPLALPLDAGTKDLPAQMLLPGGGLASPDGTIGYFPAAKGGIEAIELATGKALWVNKEAVHPLAATDKRLYAQSLVAGKPNQIQVVALDTSDNGKRVLQSKPVVFPDWVSVNVVYGRTFALGAVLDKTGLLLIWEARAHYAGGAAPPPEVEEAARKEASGVVKVDLEEGKVQLAGKREWRKVAFQSPERVMVNGRTLTVIDEAEGNVGNPLQSSRLLRATAADGRVLWQRNIAAPVQIIPPS